jgi:hypothetical protein
MGETTMTIVLESASPGPIALSEVRAGRGSEGDHEAQVHTLPCHQSA